MKIKFPGHLLIAGPCFYPLGGEGYGGMERLATLVARELAAQGYEVDVVGGARSNQIPGCRVWRGALEGSFIEAEAQAGKEYAWLLDTGVEAVIDFSHSHYSRNGRGPGISWIWHDPYLMQPPVPQSGLFALSDWQARRHQKKTGQTIEVLDPICADPKLFFYDPKVNPSSRWLSLGILDANKGQREAAELAEERGIELDIVGKGVDEKVVRAVMEVEKRTGGRVRYLGEWTKGEAAKVEMMRQHCGMLYWPSYPEGYGEAHSQKLVEALMLGMPTVVRDQGAMREVFGDIAWLADDKLIGELFKRLPDSSCGPDVFGGAVGKWRSKKAANRWSVQAATQRILDACKVKA